MSSGDNCSFCGKRPDQVFRLIAGPSCGVCNECIGKMANMVATELQTVASKIIALPPAAPPLPLHTLRQRRKRQWAASSLEQSGTQSCGLVTAWGQSLGARYPRRKRNPCRSHRPERFHPIKARPATNSCPRPAFRIGNTRPGPIGLARVYSGEIDRLFLAPPPF